MNKIKRNVQSGFTLIELMIVVAIIAILVALALPAYVDFSIRTKVAECIDGGAPIKLNIAEHFDSVGVIPPDAPTAGVGANTGVSQYCGAITYAGGAFTVTAVAGLVDPSGTRVANDITARYTPAVNPSGGLNWTCENTSGEENSRFLPAPCRGVPAPPPPP